MPGTYCCVPLCRNKSGHQFPKDKYLCRKWVVAIKREKWLPSRYSLVCRDHFKNSDYLQETVRGGAVPLIKRLKLNSIPSVFSWTKDESENSEKRKKRYLERGKRQVECKSKQERKRRQMPTSHEEIAAYIEVASDEHSVPSGSIQDQATQTDAVTEIAQQDSATQSLPYVFFSIHNFISDPKGVHFYTGLESFEKVSLVFETLGPASHELNFIYGLPPCHMDPINQFFMTLVILRRHTSYFEICRLFSILVKDVHNIFITWIKFMSLQWKEIDLWTPKPMVQFYSPSDFTLKYPSTRVILDSTECPIKKPSLPTAQQATFSSYKNCNTIKVVVGTTPRGLITYVSPSYAGSTSDRQIIERSNLPSMCESGDSIMVDKGFNVQDLFAPSGVTVNIPSFFKTGTKIQASIIDRDRKIASKRVHVERSIGLIKTYKILKGPLNATQTILSGDIFFVCCMLCNFRKNIVGGEA